MNVQRVMDSTGHTEHAFDPKNMVSVNEAMQRFDELTKKGFRAAEKRGDGDHEIVKAFDPNARETVFVPPLVGG